MRCVFHHSIADIPAGEWDSLFDSENPFVRHAFLLAMEQSGCVQAESGWHPQHLTLRDEDGHLVAVMPLYVKMNSYGEFVFDWGWAEAYARHGLDYYPKLVTAIPFSPVAGPRLGIADRAALPAVMHVVTQAIHELANLQGFSGWHLLFPGETLQKALMAARDEGALLHREAVQFHWFNQGYSSFDDFLGSLRSSRRKNIRRERRRVAEQGIGISRIPGVSISDGEWEGFFQCYQQTYLKRSGHGGYLNRAFFDQLRETMASQLMLVVARHDTEMVASSLFLFDRKRLYGRYWGALRDVSCLHFEACFYQGIEFCIENGLETFDPGTQGEHKLMRGFTPVKSTSYHWIADPRFRQAIADYLERERRGTEDYRQHAETYLPYRRGDL